MTEFENSTLLIPREVIFKRFLCSKSAFIHSGIYSLMYLFIPQTLFDHPGYQALCWRDSSISVDLGRLLIFVREMRLCRCTFLKCFGRQGINQPVSLLVPPALLGCKASTEAGLGCGEPKGMIPLPPPLREIGGCGETGWREGMLATCPGGHRCLNLLPGLTGSTTYSWP